jgi:hypothetical protein
MAKGGLVADSVMVALIEEQLQSVENRAPCCSMGSPVRSVRRLRLTGRSVQWGVG